MYNSDELVRRIVGWFKNGKGRPFILELRPTNRCNLRCPSCVARGHPGGQAGTNELSENDYLRIIDEAAELGVRYVQISGGGEPFMYGDGLLRMMRHIKRHGINGWVITNGTLLSEKIINEIVRMRWDSIHLSLDAPEPVTNDFLRGKAGSFDKIVTSMKQFSTMKEKYGCETPEVNVAIVLSHYNCGMIIEIIKLCADLGAEWVMFQTVHVRPGLEGEHFLLTAEDLVLLADVIPRAQKLAAELGIRSNLDGLSKELLESSNDPRSVIRDNSHAFGEHPFLSTPCFSPWYYMGISPEGAIGPCSLLDNSTYGGDIRSSTLREFWRGPHLKSLRERLMRKELLRPCHKCVGTHIIETKNLRERLRKFMGSG